MAGLASKGILISGFDPDESKLRLIDACQSPIYEPGLNELLDSYSHNIDVYSSLSADIFSQSSASFICIGTPYTSSAGLDFSSIFRAIDSILETIATNPSDFTQPHHIFIRSTVDSTFLNRVLQYSKRFSEDINSKVTFTLFPEFLREGSALSDFFDEKALSVFATNDSPDSISSYLRILFAWNPPSLVSIESAAYIKLISNSWHALKVAFTNEVSQILFANNCNSTEVLELFTSESKLNISSAYMKPGFAFGGSCLTKDLKGLIHLASEHETPSALLSATLESNSLFINRVSQDIINLSPSKILFLGIAFKPATDDLRSSPYLRIAQSVYSHVSDLFLYDYVLSEQLTLSKISRSNYLLLSDLCNHLIPSLDQILSSFINDPSAVIVISSQKYISLLSTFSCPKASIFNLSSSPIVPVPSKLIRYV